MAGKSTNKNFLAISGAGDAMLVAACKVLGLWEESALASYQITRDGTTVINNKGGKKSGAVLSIDEKGVTWSIVDYRTAYTDAEIADKVKDLKGRAPSRSVVESTQLISPSR